MAKVRGTNFATLKEFIHKRFGSAGWERMVRQLSAKDQESLSSIVPISWYDYDLHVKILRILETQLGAGDSTLLDQLGRLGAERDLGTITRLFLKMASPSYAVEKIGEYWSRFNDFGSWSVVRNGSQEVVGALTGTPFADDLFCSELQGYIHRTLELVGAKNVKIVHTLCKGRGDAVCEFKGTWD